MPDATNTSFTMLSEEITHATNTITTPQAAQNVVGIETFVIVCIAFIGFICIVITTAWCQTIKKRSRESPSSTKAIDVPPHYCVALNMPKPEYHNEDIKTCHCTTEKSDKSSGIHPLQSEPCEYDFCCRKTPFVIEDNVRKTTGNFTSGSFANLLGICFKHP